MSQQVNRAASQKVSQSLASTLFNKENFKYLLTTHFWGPASNFGIPLAAIYDLKKDPETISGSMTGALILYSGVFMRYALAVTPRNFLLFGCHVINSTAQVGQAYRWTNYWYFGGKEAADKAKADAAGAAASAIAAPITK